MSPKQAVLGVTITALVSACGGGGSGGDTESFVAPEELPSCVPGVWINDAPDCFCGSEDTDDPECAHEDCVISSVLVLRSDGVAAQMETRRSPSAGTVSVLRGCSAIRAGEWELDGEQLVRRDLSERSNRVQCSTSELRVEDSTGFNRADDDLARVLRETPDRDDCTGLSYR